MTTLSTNVCSVPTGDLVTVEPVWAFEVRTPCRSQDPELWFAEDRPTVERAQSLCRMCPLQQECLAGAVARREPWGVWGGEVFEQGEIVAHKRRPGRPRKDEHLTRAIAEAELAQRLSGSIASTIDYNLQSCLDASPASIPAQRDGAAA